MEGLETRGIRPDPAMRDFISAFVYTELRRELRNAQPYIDHEVIWGVPCGPTLSMVRGTPRTTGIVILIDGEEIND